jgi:hypothetical protein
MLKYVCDVCGKEMAASERGVMSLAQRPPEWATILLSLPIEPVGKEASPSYEPLVQLLVCSLSCAETALDEVKEHLRKAFEGKDDT